jgi:hypothetical protein
MRRGTISAMWEPLVIVTMVGCGRIYFDPQVDAGTGDAFALNCGPWQADVLLSDLQSPAFDWDPGLSPDGNVLVFSSDRAVQNALELYATTRTAAITFGPPQNITAINAATSNESPTWLPSGDGMYFVSDRTGAVRLWYSSYDGASFGTPELVSELANTYVQGPTVSHDGLELLFVDDQVGQHIVRATRPTVSSPWTIVGTVPELEVNDSAGWPTFAIDDLHIVIQSGIVFPRLFASQRASRTLPFEPPLEITDIYDVNALSYSDPELSPDGTTLIHAREDVGSMTSYDLYAATRVCN